MMIGCGTPIGIHTVVQRGMENVSFVTVRGSEEWGEEDVVG